TSLDGDRVAGVDRRVGYTPPRNGPSPRRRASPRARSVRAVRRRGPRGADAVEPRALVPDAAAPSGDRARLRRTGAARASVGGAVWTLDDDDRATPVRGADALCANAHGAGDATR